MVDDLKKQDFHIVAITRYAHCDASARGLCADDSGTLAITLLDTLDADLPMLGQCGRGRRYSRNHTEFHSEWWGTLYKDFVSQGHRGIWNDMNDPRSSFVEKTMPGISRIASDEQDFKGVASHRIHDVSHAELPAT